MNWPTAGSLPLPPWVPEEFRQKWETVQAFARGAGRDPSQLHSAQLLYVCVDDNRERARERMEAYVDAIYRRSLDADSTFVFGPAEMCAERIQAFIDAGTGTVILGPPALDIGQLEAFVQKVVPRLNLSP